MKKDSLRNPEGISAAVFFLTTTRFSNASICQNAKNKSQGLPPLAFVFSFLLQFFQNTL